MATNLNVSLVIRAIDRATAPMRAVTGGFRAMRESKQRADKAFASAANLRQAGDAVERFAGVARSAVASPIRAFEEFDQAMASVAAVSGNLLPGQFEKLEAKAKELGATTGFTATEAAQGLQFFAIAGFDAEEAMTALPSAMDLAVASGSDLARTSDILSDIMGAFGKEASDATSISDQLATTLTNSNTTLETLFETMKLVGPIAADLKFPMSDVAAMAGVLGSAGIKGSLAGTALRSSMLKLAAPSSKARDILKKLGIAMVDGNGDMRNMIDILSEVADRTKGAGTAVRVSFLKELTGLRAVSGISKLLATGGDELKRFSAQIQNSSGAVKEMAEIRFDNARGKTAILTSALSGLLITVGEQLNPVLSAAKGILTDVINVINAWASRNPGLTKTLIIAAAAIAGLTTAIAALMFTLATATTALGVFNLAMGGTKTGAQLMSLALKPIGGLITRFLPTLALWTASWWASAPAVLAATWPILAIIAAIALLIAAVVIVVRHWDTLTGVWERFKNASLKTKIVLSLLLGPIVALLAPFLAIAFVAKKIIDNWDPISTFFRDLFGFIKESLSAWTLLSDKISEFKLPGPLQTFFDLNVAAVEAIGDAIGGVAAETKFIATGGEAGAVDLQTSEFLRRTEGASEGGSADVAVRFLNAPPFEVESSEASGIGLSVDDGLGGLVTP